MKKYPCAEVTYDFTVFSPMGQFKVRLWIDNEGFICATDSICPYIVEYQNKFKELRYSEVEFLHWISEQRLINAAQLISPNGCGIMAYVNWP